jgi:hypothetical protein
VVAPPPADAAATPLTSCAGDPPTPEHVCVQDCGEPVVREGDPPPGWSWLSPDEAQSRELHGCPRCLPADAAIATPGGEVAIADLRPGDPVWTLDAAGARIEARVLAVRSTPARDGHALARLTLDDGRVVAASAPHPIGDGRELGALRAGDLVDGARVRSVERIVMSGDRTWDLTVSGPTGLYLAGGVALRSTLTASR